MGQGKQKDVEFSDIHSGSVLQEELMSVLDGKVIDASALNNKTVILAIFDALPWREYIIETHITALQNNGGITRTEVEFFLDEDRYMRKTEPGCGIDIQYFYSLDKIRETYEKMVSEESIAPSFIPIACDSYGDQILLQSQNEPEKGVFFAGCESAAGRNGLWPLVRITDSFTEFLGMLTPFRELVE